MSTCLLSQLQKTLQPQADDKGVGQDAGQSLAEEDTETAQTPAQQLATASQDKARQVQSKLEAAVAEISAAEDRRLAGLQALEGVRAEVVSLTELVVEQQEKSGMLGARVAEVTAEAASLWEDLNEAATTAASEARASRQRLEGAMSELRRLEGARMGASQAANRMRVQVGGLHPMLDRSLCLPVGLGVLI